ncbi:MAG TPA: DNA-processing protein DprA [Polyangia bacterium]|nr:DNA-processing protein DprA [Polyangia bacterium]
MASQELPIAALLPIDPRYPRRLGELGKPPATLWVVGRAPAGNERGVAMVGSRAATVKGCARATEMAAVLGRSGWFVVSGGALGIDAAAHQGALQVGAATFAVLGCGVDVVYPDRHRSLFARIAAAGGILSELPPATPPRPGQFPVRNRLVAALGDAVLVVEADRMSGALITAKLARKLGRLVLAVPGSAGTDQLIAAGAADPVDDAHDVLARLAGGPAKVAVVPEGLRPLCRALAAGADTPPGLAQKLGRPLPEVLGLLFEAELSGWVRRLPGGRFEVPHAN